ncbi:MAG: lipopolysaccharide heptosyltransferase I [Gammaproteobacteria bacterium]|nr:lipopolysaccharide heptosyltransferase I [Gammaproteobacteria bacterium]
MRVLIIKMSSLGDIIHALPALTDAQKNYPDIKIDWVVEPSFAEIPAFHSAVKNIIPAPLRKWRKNIFQTLKNAELEAFHKLLNQDKHDVVIDAQGLIKSGIVAWFSKGTRCGYDRNSIREPLASFFYNKSFNINWDFHAIPRIRRLFAESLNYAFVDSAPDYGIDKNKFPQTRNNYCVFLHGTAREDKCWPENLWEKFIVLLNQHHPELKILLPWGNTEEQLRAERLAKTNSAVEVLPKSTLRELAGLLLHSKFNIAVDTGLGHLSAALDAPTISLYGPTDPKLIGTVGKNQIHIKRDSMEAIQPEIIIESLANI